jgi:restriction system protein
MATPVESRDVQLFPDFCFPSEEHRDGYIALIVERDPKEVVLLIRAFLMPTCILGGDVDRITGFLRDDRDKALEIEQVRRFLREDLPWEGITWVLDLLHRPRMAIDVIHAYLAAHFWWLPDGRISGLFDAMNLIRAAYLAPVHPRDELLIISPRDFELVIALLFSRRDFEVQVTQQSRDGGYDVRLCNKSAACAESSVVECKRYTENVGVKEVRALLGVVEREAATRGLLVTTAGFTRAARSEALRTHRIELIDYDALCVLFNENFGPNWLTTIDSIISEAQRQFDGK